MQAQSFSNPFRPGAGHMPPYLAGRTQEQSEFKRLLGQKTILQNLILTGLRGVGKTVLLETFKPTAIKAGWLWVGTDLSESASVSEEHLSIRLITDLSVVTSNIPVSKKEKIQIGFNSTPITTYTTANFHFLKLIYDQTPGLPTDKIKSVLNVVWQILPKDHIRGIVFAYDEAQNLADHAHNHQYPLSVLLEAFQSIQRTGIPFMLVLTGLPTLFPKLIEARTYSERMFHVIFLGRLNEIESREAITKPIEDASCPVRFSEPSVKAIIKISGGYPYFIQFICREVFDVWAQKLEAGVPPSIPIEEIVRKLDTDFFAGRWARATDRQRELLKVIAFLNNSDEEFTVQDIVQKSKQILAKPFGASHANQILSSLSQAGLVYKNRHGRYVFAVPLMSGFIRRQYAGSDPTLL